MSKLDDLKAEATELGLTFSGNIGEEALQKKINDYMDSRGQAAVNAVMVDAPKANTKVLDTEAEWRRLVKIREEEANKEVLVIIVDNDPRENHLTTTVTVTSGNAEFTLGTMIYPLNNPTMVKQGHLDVIKDVMIPMHLLDNSSGQMQTVMRKRYSISNQ
jgi:mRNA-degrading endonuclease toxin of MazEF toxin-antitoxin module